MKYAIAALALAACSSAPKDPIAELEDPSTCMACHPQHYSDWSGSMHAYASDDPVFVAMNNRGQREAQLGTFCAQCHVPMAVVDGKTDFTDFDPTTLPPTERGITCYFCHNVKDVQADHNNGLQIALDQTMRGGAKNPVDTPAHDSQYDATLMASETNQSKMCGSCHDVVTPAPASVMLERTYTEWQASLFSQNNPAAFLPQTCSGCHMIASTAVIAQGPGLNVGTRTYGFHDHSLPAIDVAITPFPNMDTQATGIATEIEGSIAIVGPLPITGPPAPGGICVDPDNGGEIRVRVDSFQIGHMYPSGAAQDRRAWLEVLAYASGSDTPIFSSGVVGDTQDPEDIADPMVDCTNPGTLSCSGFWDRAVKADGTPAHFFWEVVTETSHQLKPPVTSDPTSPLFDHSTTASYVIGALLPQVDHITARLRTRPITYAVLNDLVTSGDLPSQYATLINTVEDAGSMKMWTAATADPVTGCSPN